MEDFMQTIHGYNVIEMYKIDKDRALVLIEREGHLDNWVTWTMNLNDGNCANGEYCPTAEIGRQSFERRKEVFQQLNAI
jgi:hypothetical protein